MKGAQKKAWFSNADALVHMNLSGSTEDPLGAKARVLVLVRTGFLSWFWHTPPMLNHLLLLRPWLHHLENGDHKKTKAKEYSSTPVS